MFTGNTIKLRSFDGLHSLQVIRDCNFSYAAKAPSRLDKRIVSCATKAHLNEALGQTEIDGIITTNELAKDVPDDRGLAITETPYRSLLSIHEDLCEIEGFHWKDFPTVIDPTATIHPSAAIAQKNVRIGSQSIVQANAVIDERTIIGAHCLIGPCSVVGAGAFEVNSHVSPRRILRQAGGVLLEDHVEMEAGCTIVRSTFGGFTTLGAETKLDCQIHLAHDCLIGKRVSFAACAEISGRVKIGDDTFVGPNVSVSNGITIGKNAHLTIGAVVVRNVEDHERVTGNFALPHRRWIAFIKSIR